MRVSEAMTRDVKICTPGQTIREVAKTMQEIDAGAMPVGENDRLIGMITDRDIAIRAVAEGKLDATVGEIASKDVVSVDPQQSLEEAARLMAQHQIRRLPVCEEDGRLVGILAQADVAQIGHDELTGEVVQRISQ